MEVNEVRRGGRVVSAGTAAGKKAAAGPASLRPSRADKLALSRQAVAYLEERNRQFMEEAQHQQDSSSADKGKLDILEKGLKALNKCQKIYARVVKGDKVPPEDLRYLEKNDPEGYKMALALRQPNRHPREWESELDDEDRASLQNGDGGAEASPEKPVQTRT